MLTSDLIRTREILHLSKNIIKPFYEGKMKRCLALIDEIFTGCNCKIHVPEGAMFLWLWFPDLPVTSRELYRRLKKRNVLVVSGDYFFPGLEDEWAHTNQCLRINYSQDEKDVHEGLRLIAEEIKTLT
jgi:valine--pyruvate aminotransferase